MKKTTKTFLTVGISAVGIGFILCIVSLVMGFRGGFGIGLDGKYIDFSEKNNSFQRLKKTQTDPFTSLDINLSYADLELIPSDGYYIEFSASDVEYSVSNGTLIISESYNDSLGTTFFSFFNGPTFFGGSRKNEFGIIKVYYPQASSLVSAGIKCSFGDIKIDGLSAENLELQIDCGDLRLSNTYAADFSVNSDFGNITGRNLSGEIGSVITESGDIELSHAVISNDFTVENDFGSTDLSDITAASINITCEAGGIDIEDFATYNLNINGKYGDVEIDKPKDGKDAYNISLEADYGDISVGNREYSSEFIRELGMPRSIRVKVDSGDIDLW